MDGSSQPPIISSLPEGYHLDCRFGLVYGVAPQTTDDLTQLAGLTLQHMAALNHTGVYCFGQIALWKYRELNSFHEVLDVPLRQLIDLNWVEQARARCRSTVTVRQFTLQPVFRLLATAAISMLAGVVLLISMLPAQPQAFQGMLAATTTEIATPVFCELDELLVQHGDEVFSGDTICTLKNLEIIRRTAELEQEVAAAAEELRRIEAQTSLETDRRSLELEAEIAELNMSFQQWLPTSDSRSGNHLQTGWSSSRSGRMQQTLARFADASNTQKMLFFNSSSSVPGGGAASPNGSSDSAPTPTQPATPDNRSSVLHQIQQRMLRLEEVQKQMPEQVEVAMGLDTAQENLARLQDQLAVLRRAETSIEVKAPSHGIIAEILAQPGEHRDAAQVLLRILHEDRRYIQLTLDTARIHELAEGAEVELIFPGNQVRSGLVSRIPLIARTPSATADTTASITIMHSGKLWPSLPMGTDVQVIPIVCTGSEAGH